MIMFLGKRKEKKRREKEQDVRVGVAFFIYFN